MKVNHLTAVSFKQTNIAIKLSYNKYASQYIISLNNFIQSLNLKIILRTKKLHKIINFFTLYAELMKSHFEND